MKTNILLTILILPAFFSCRSLENHFESGDYSAVYNRVKRKILRNGEPKKEHLQLLEAAFSGLTERDLSKIHTLSSSQNSNDYYKIMQLYLKIDRRQDDIKPYLPILQKNGYDTNIRFIRADEKYEETKVTYLVLLLDEIDGLMENANHRNDRLAARKAYAKARQYLTYDWNARVDSLKYIAEEKGTVNVLLHVENRTYHSLSQFQHREIMSLLAGNDDWVKSHTDPFLDYDYEVRFVLEDVFIGPEQIHRDQYWDRATVSETEYVLDENGNVKKDSLGNDITVKVERPVRAKINVFTQQRISQLSGAIQIYDHGNQLISGYPLQSEVVFEHRYAHFRGDKRALTNRSKRLLNQIPVPYPNHVETFDLAVNQLFPAMRKIIQREKLI